MDVQRGFPASPESVRAARVFVTDVLADADVDADLVQLLTSELATNAVLHARSQFRVRVIGGARSVRVEIVNSEPELLLAMREPSERGGRGLQLVKDLSADWGFESSRDDKTVWFEVPASSRERLIGRE